MKVLFIQPYWSFLDLENVLMDKFTGYNACACSKKGYDVAILSFLRGKHGVVPKTEKICLHFNSAVSISVPSMLPEFPYFLNLEQAIKQINPDIVHINNLPFLTTLQSTKIAKKIGIPSIVHVHGVIGKSNKLLDFAQYSYLSTLNRNVFKNATFMVCLTASDAKEIQKCGCPPEKIRMIPNGVDVEKFDFCNEGTENQVFWGGRFVKQKGLEYLMNALRLVAVKQPAVNLTLTGDGPMFPKITKLSHQLKLENNVTFKGRVPRDQLPGLISNAAIYVLPSLKEGMPFALLEAMACGKAVIGTDIPGISDVVTDGVNGLIVPPRDSKALANALLRLLKDPALRRKLGSNARQLMVERYDWNVTHKKIEQLYFEALKKHCPTSGCSLTLYAAN